MVVLLTWAPLDCLYSQPSEEPAPVVLLQKAPRIDGKSDDWPFPPPLKATSDLGSATLRFGYDEKFFYALVEVAEKNPWLNNPSRPEEAIKSGSGIALFFQTSAGNEQRVLITPAGNAIQILAFRSRSNEKKPYTFASPAGELTFDYVGPLPRASAATIVSGSGYALELALPWKSLGLAKLPKSFRFDTQILFADAAGTTNLGSAWWHAKDGPGATIEDLPTEARLYPDTWGKALLISEAPVSKRTPSPSEEVNRAKNLIKIDLPRSGKLSLYVTSEDGWILRELVTAEKYEQGKHEIPWDGRDRYGAPLPLGSYRWRALLFDGMGARFMGSVGNSGRPPYRTSDGLGSLGGQHGFVKAIAADSDGLYMCGALQEGPPAMRKIEPRTGRALWKRSAGSFQSITDVAASGDLACILNVGNKSQNFHCDLVRIDPKSGKDVKMGSANARLPVRTPPVANAIGGLAIVGTRAFYSVPSENRIGSVDLTTGEEKPAITIAAPAGLGRLNDHQLAVCSRTEILSLELDSGSVKPIISGLDAPRAIAATVDGAIFVSDLGKSQQIKCYSKEYKWLEAYGLPGGKAPWMAQYNPLAFNNVTGIAVGPDGNLWLAEEDETPNRFVKLSSAGAWLEDFYGPTAYNTVGPDLDDLSTVYYNSGGNVRTPLLIETKLNYAKYQENPEMPSAAWSIKAIYDLGLAADGISRNELMSKVASSGYGHIMAFKAENGKRYLFRPSKANRARSVPGAGLWTWKSDRWIPCAFLSADTTEPSWSDGNADGIMQPEERYSMSPVQRLAWIERDFALNGFRGRVVSQNVNEHGIPSYQSAVYSPYLKDSEMEMLGKQWSFGSREVDGAVYYVANIGPHRHLSFWDRASENRLMKVEDGTVQWLVGEHSSNPKDTEFATASGIAGIVDDIVLPHNVEPANYPAFTTDGFALGNVLVDENGNRSPEGPVTINIENFTGLFVKDPQTGKRVLFAVSSGDDRILEITGPGAMARSEGIVELSNTTAGKNEITIPYSTWYGNTAQDIGIDGEPDEWDPSIPSVSIPDRDQVVADFRFRRDAGALHLFATVLDPNEMRRNPEIRVSLARSRSDEDKFSISFLTPPNSSGSNIKMRTTLSHQGQEIELKKVKAVTIPRWRNLGYHVEAEIPLDLLPELTAPRTQTFRRGVKSSASGKVGLKAQTEVRADLTGALFLKMEVRQVKDGQPQWLSSSWIPVELTQSSTLAP